MSVLFDNTVFCLDVRAKEYKKSPERQDQFQQQDNDSQSALTIVAG